MIQKNVTLNLSYFEIKIYFWNTEINFYFYGNA